MMSYDVTNLDDDDDVARSYADDDGYEDYDD